MIVVAHYAGMTVAQMTEFRKRMKEAGGAVKVAKNKLAKLALKDTDVGGISDLLKGQTCVAYSEDPVSAAQGVGQVRQGERQARDPRRRDGQDGDGRQRRQGAGRSAVARRAAGPSCIGLLQAPATKIARVLKEPGAKLARVLPGQRPQEAKGA